MNKVSHTADNYASLYPVKVSDWFEETRVKRLTFEVYRDLIGTEKNIKVIDWGCGNGLMGFGLFPQAEICGVDVDPDAIKYAESNAKINNINFSGYLGKDINVPNDYFDIAINFGLIEFLDEQNFELIFRKIYASLKSGGLMFCTLYTWRPCSASYLQYTLKSICKLQNPYNYYVKTLGCDISKKSFLDVETDLKKIGFKVRDKGGINPYPSHLWRFVRSNVNFVHRSKFYNYWSCTQYILLEK